MSKLQILISLTYQMIVLLKKQMINLKVPIKFISQIKILKMVAQILTIIKIILPTAAAILEASVVH